MESSKAEVNKGIMEAVENQLNDEAFPEVKQTYERLAGLKIGDAEIRKLIGAVLMAEIVQCMQQKRTFDRDQYVERLGKLPDTSWLKSQPIG
jgi:aminoglycoside phosphotransferase (APT) family kinase protein